MANDYRAGITEQFPGTHTLPPEREAGLRMHLTICELPYLQCIECAELYEHLGYVEYAKLVTEVEATHGPTESEGCL